MFEIDRGKKFYKNTFQNFSNNNDIEHYSRNTYLGAVFAERFIKSIGTLLKIPVFEKSDGISIDVLPIITKQYNNRVHTSTKLTPMQASLKKNEVIGYKKLLENKS